jgi:dienelactone hydrolase
MCRFLWPLPLSLVLVAGPSVAAEGLPDTKPLTRTGDLAAEMVEGIDKYLMRELAASMEKRQAYWNIDASSAKAYTRSVEPNRERLRKMLGVVDPRVPFTELEVVGRPGTSPQVGEAEKYQVFAVRWPVLPGVDGEGLLLEPRGKVVGQVVALPDADWTPEMLVGLAPGVSAESYFPCRLAENGCRVVVPVLIDRRDEWSANPKVGRTTNQPHREFIYRMAYQMGRHMIGYEVQKVLAAVDHFCRDKAHAPVGVYGYGEGGMIAMYSAALDTRIQATVISGYFGPRERLWQEPIYRNVFGLLREFGDAAVLQLILPRQLTIEHSDPPHVDGPPRPHDCRGASAAPGQVPTFTVEEISAELKQISRKVPFTNGDITGDFEKLPGHATPVFLSKLAKVDKYEVPRPIVAARKDTGAEARQKRQFDQLVQFTQQVMRDSERIRAANFWAMLDTSSLEKYTASTAAFRKELWEEVLGKLPDPTLPINPQAREVHDQPKWKGYEVTLDLYPDVFAYGILLVPKDLKAGMRRPVVVCQHGLEGRPSDVVNPTKRTPYYNSFGAQLANLGYIVYAPQNPYIGHDKFRVLQRKANPLGLSLFSFIIRQHERTLDWLATLPFVDPEKMAFYGLSYGGKTAMRVPAVLPRYCLSICSGDFNEWTWKNASVDYVNSYMFSGEYEMPEFNLGSTMVYAEMAALIAPRPFMVERGHDDGVGIDEWVAYEYAKVRRHYSRLKLPDRTTIEFFAGGHEINGVGTFAFLQNHLGWPAKRQP